MTPMSRIQADRSNAIGLGAPRAWLGRGPHTPTGGLLARLALLGAGLVLAVGSGSPGERAESGVCPEGETCSDETPRGLYFKGPSFGDAWLDADVHPTAVGGRQTITLDRTELFATLPAFDAESSTPAFTITSIAHPQVTIRAQSAGTAYLRILQPGTDQLYDRLQIRALDVTEVTVDPLHGWLDPTPDTGVLLHYGGTPVTFIARIYAGGTRLIDEDLAFELLAGGSLTSQTGSSWDIAHVQATQGATSLSMRARASDGTRGEGRAFLAWEIDGIQVSERNPWPESAVVGEPLLTGFYGTLDGSAVAGVPFTFRLWDPDGIEAQTPVLGFTSSILVIDFNQAGAWLLSVEGLGLTRSFQITVLDPPSPPPPPPAPQVAPDTQPARDRAARLTTGGRLPLALPRWGGPGRPGCRAASALAAPQDADGPGPVVHVGEKD